MVTNLLLLPVLLVQAVWVMATVRRLPEAAGPREGVAGQDAPLRLLIVGDSSAAGVGAATQDAALAGHVLRHLERHVRVTWRLEARNGATTAQTLARLRAMEPEVYDVVLIALGVNDVKNGARRHRWRQNYTDLIALAETRFHARLVCASGLPPIGLFKVLPQPLRRVMGCRAQRFDADLSALCATDPKAVHLTFDLPLIPQYLAEDGFHPGPPVYDAWARRVREAIRDRLGV